MDQYDFSSKDELIKAITFRDGKVFISDQEIPVASKGEPGLVGKQGITGSPPAHEWDGTKIRFKNPDGTWGPLVELKGKAGPGGLIGGLGRIGETGSSGRPGKDGIDGDLGPQGKTGEPGKNGRNGIDGAAGTPGRPGSPGIEPKEMGQIRIDLGLMKDALEAMGLRVSNVRDGINGTDGKDGKDGADGVSVQGAKGPAGDKGEPGPPPNDWQVLLNQMAAVVQAFDDQGVII